jgi:hypothetical protein
MQGITTQTLRKIMQETKAPFSYNLGIKVFPSKQNEAPIMICCHGYGANNKIGDAIYSWNVVQDHIVSFNFPDYELRNYDPKKSTFGSIKELLPLLYVLKKCVIDGQQEKISLYGFSAGGAAIINMLAVLNCDTYDARLKEIGINADDKKKIKGAVQQGIIILDAPLKSIEEVMALRGESEEFKILARRYADNGMRPIDAIEKLTGLPLTIVLYFENPDEILGNRDDQLFIDRLKKANSGTTEIITGSYGGHNTHHQKLWERYKKIV